MVGCAFGWANKDERLDSEREWSNIGVDKVAKRSSFSRLTLILNAVRGLFEETTPSPARKQFPVPSKGFLRYILGKYRTVMSSAEEAKPTLVSTTTSSNIADVHVPFVNYCLKRYNDTKSNTHSPTYAWCNNYVRKVLVKQSLYFH